MDLSRHNGALIRGMLVGAVVLAGASACSRSDRTETGSNNTGAVTADTMSAGSRNNAVTPPAGDTSSAAIADTTTTPTPSDQPRAQTAVPDAEGGANQDTSTAGYRGMERDTAEAGTEAPSDTAPRDSARVTADSAAASAEQSSSSPTATPSDSAPMEVATPSPADTAETPIPDEAVAADSSVEMAGAAGDSVTVRDTTSMPEPADTGMAAGEVAVAVDGEAAAGAGANDTVVSVGDSTNVAKTGERLDPAVASAEANDTLAEPEAAPVRPPEDSTEVHGNVEEPNVEDNVTQEDRETVAAAEAQPEADNRNDQVGAAAIGGNVNGADAVALMTRQGARCIVVDPETDDDTVVDMSETPATLNPCGLGSMVLTRIWTQKE